MAAGKLDTVVGNSVLELGSHVLGSHVAEAVMSNNPTTGKANVLEWDGGHGKSEDCEYDCLLCKKGSRQADRIFLGYQTGRQTSWTCSTLDEARQPVQLRT